MRETARRHYRMKQMYARRNRSRAGINLVSLMDIFTILVFFLLVNSSEVDVLPNSKSIKLPQSLAEKMPDKTLVILVNNENIVMEGKSLASVNREMNSDNPTINRLAKELDYHFKRQAAAHKDKDKPFRGKITIMGDKEIPYKLLKKIMLTCTKSKYSQISLAVVRRAREEQG